MLRNLEQSDIIIVTTTETGDDPLHPKMHPELFTEKDEACVIKEMVVNDRISHVMTYLDDKTVAHATNGLHQLGVRSHALFGKSGMITSVEFPISRHVVIRCKDPLLRQNIAKAALVWDAHAPHYREQLHKMVAENKQSAVKQKLKLFTPYTATGTRKADTGNLADIECKEAYRAFRAYLRNKTKKPLSKNKGVNCNEFIAYCIKVGAIDTLFPKGIPQTLLYAIITIENQKARMGYKKLSQIPARNWAGFKDTLIDAFISITTHANDKNGQSNLKSSRYLLDCFLLIFMKTKSMNPSTFLNELMQHESLWEMTGYLCFAHTQGQAPAPSVISHRDCAALCIGLDRRDSLLVDEKAMTPVSQK